MIIFFKKHLGMLVSIINILFWFILILFDINDYVLHNKPPYLLIFFIFFFISNIYYFLKKINK